MLYVASCVFCFDFMIASHAFHVSMFASFADDFSHELNERPKNKSISGRRTDLQYPSGII